MNNLFNEQQKEDPTCSTINKSASPVESVCVGIGDIVFLEGVSNP